MTVTLKEVAARASVSRSAVSRTFTEGASVSAKTREKVRQAAEELGYRPSLIARSLATNRTRLIGLVANNFRNPVFLEVFDLFTRVLQERGFRPLLVNLSTETDPQKSLEMLKQSSAPRDSGSEIGDGDMSGHQARLGVSGSRHDRHCQER